MKVRGNRFTISEEENLYLRPAHLTDAPAIFGLIDTQRAYLREWLPFVDATTSVKDTQQFLAYATAPDNVQDKVYVILAQLKVIGIIGFKQIDYLNKSLEIGYWLSEHEQGKDIMRRACVTLINFAFGSMNFNRIQLKVAIGNTRSRNIPHKLGFKLEGIQREGELLNGRFHDLEVYSLLRREWEN